jgi:hypothetical protein
MQKYYLNGEELQNFSSLRGMIEPNILETLPDDFPKQSFLPFFQRFNETCQSVFRADEYKIASHPAVLKDSFIQNIDNDIFVWYLFTNREDSSDYTHNKNLPWYLEMVEISWGKDYLMNWKNEKQEFSISLGRDCKHLVRLTTNGKMNYITYQENQTPDEEFGFSYAFGKDRKKYFKCANFKNHYNQEVIMDKNNKITENIITQRHKSNQTIIPLPPKNKTNNSDMLCSFNGLKQISLSSKTMTTEFKESLKEINTIITSIKEQKRTNLLQHSIFNNSSNEAQMIMTYRWKPDQTVQLHVEKLFDNNLNLPVIGYEIVFDNKAGYPKQYRVGNLPSIKHSGDRFKFNGIEIIVDSTGNPMSYQRFSDGQLQYVEKK